ncbi:MAG: DNA-3-methyladenine glycosylase I [Chlorobi bacterium]|nr:DNA-3-methyladenine glycosylase I [Chlorobiota bacterium]MCI0715616.1 DNA-3-methyladenine glycosylase I [Chlorobiota bacterium]
MNKKIASRSSQLLNRCPWCGSDPLYVRYHDKEWGVPVHNDKKLFEFLVLEGFQAGLSWRTILYKRENFCNAFDNFDADKIARYNKRKIQSLLNDAGIIRNRLKIEATVTNARAYLNILDRYNSFDEYLWQFTDGRVIKNKWKSLKQLPATTKESDLMSKTLLKDGFKFVGSTICYAHMQATGMVNDHLISCYRYGEV